MPTVSELLQQYDKDPELQKEVNEILADGKITMTELKTFAKKHNVNVSITELPQLIDQARKAGLLDLLE